MVLSEPKIKLLNSLQEPKTYSELRKVLNVSETAFLKHLKDLIKKELIVKSEDGKYVLTDKGKRELREIKHLEREKEKLERMARTGDELAEDALELSRLTDEELKALILGTKSKTIARKVRKEYLVEEKGGRYFLTDWGMEVVLVWKPEIYRDEKVWAKAKEGLIKLIRGTTSINDYIKEGKKLFPKGEVLEEAVYEAVDLWLDEVKEWFLRMDDIEDRNGLLFESGNVLESPLFIVVALLLKLAKDHDPKQILHALMAFVASEMD
jgi:predicted transcriptional regulator